MPYDFPYMPLMPQQSHLPQAEAAMNLSPQEQSLYLRHLQNLYSPMGGVDVPGGRSTIYQIGVGTGGKEYNIPTVYEGNILSPEKAIARAMSEGIGKFPSYPTAEEAENRYQQMHEFMAQDTADYNDQAEEMVRNVIDGR